MDKVACANNSYYYNLCADILLSGSLLFMHRFATILKRRMSFLSSVLISTLTFKVAKFSISTFISFCQNISQTKLE